MDKRSHSLYLAALLLVSVLSTGLKAVEMDPYFRQWLPTLLSRGLTTNSWGEITKMFGRTRFIDFELSTPGSWTWEQIESGQDLGGLYCFLTFGMFETNDWTAKWEDFEK